MNKPSFISNRVQVLALSFATFLTSCIEHVSPTKDPAEIVAGYQGGLSEQEGLSEIDAQEIVDSETLDQGVPVDEGIVDSETLDQGVPVDEGIVDLEMLDQGMPVDEGIIDLEMLDQGMPVDEGIVDFEMLDQGMPVDEGIVDFEMLDQGGPIIDLGCSVRIDIVENSKFLLMEDEQLLFSFAVEPQGCDVSFHEISFQLQNLDPSGLPPNGTFADYVHFVRIIQEPDFGVLEEYGYVVDGTNLISDLYFDCLADEPTVFHVKADLRWQDIEDFDYTTNINGEFSFFNLLPVFAQSSFVEMSTGEYPSEVLISPAEVSFADIPVQPIPLFQRSHEPFVRGSSVDAHVGLNFFGQQVREHLDNAQFMQISLHDLHFVYTSDDVNLQSVVLVDEFGVDVEGQIVDNQMGSGNIVFTFEDLNLLDGALLHFRFDYFSEVWDQSPSLTLYLVQGTYSVNGGLPIPLNHEDYSLNFFRALDTISILVGF